MIWLYWQASKFCSSDTVQLTIPFKTTSWSSVKTMMTFGGVFVNASVTLSWSSKIVDQVKAQIRATKEREQNVHFIVFKNNTCFHIKIDCGTDSSVKICRQQIGCNIWANYNVIAVNQNQWNKNGMRECVYSEEKKERTRETEIRTLHIKWNQHNSVLLLTSAYTL